MRLPLFFRIKFSLFKEQIRVFQRFYKVKSFIFIDLIFAFISFFSNPYRTCKVFWKKEGFSGKIYGETPLSVFSEISLWADIQKEALFLDMGSGRGKLCFWSAFFIGCSVTGIEKVPLFHKSASFLQRLFGIKNLQFLQKDFLEIDYSSYSVIYFYATAQKETFVKEIFLKMLSCKKETKILTVSSFPSEYFPEEFFLVKKKSVCFPWGKTEIFLSRRR